MTRTLAENWKFHSVAVAMAGRGGLGRGGCRNRGRGLSQGARGWAGTGEGQRHWPSGFPLARSRPQGGGPPRQAQPGAQGEVPSALPWAPRLCSPQSMGENTAAAARRDATPPWARRAEPGAAGEPRPSALAAAAGAELQGQTRSEVRASSQVTRRPAHGEVLEREWLGPGPCPGTTWPLKHGLASPAAPRARLCHCHLGLGRSRLPGPAVPQGLLWRPLPPCSVAHHKCTGEPQEACVCPTCLGDRATWTAAPGRLACSPPPQGGTCRNDRDDTVSQQCHPR